MQAAVFRRREERSELKMLLTKQREAWLDDYRY
jgi:hypothetical protein